MCRLSKFDNGPLTGYIDHMFVLIFYLQIIRVKEPSWLFQIG